MPVIFDVRKSFETRSFKPYRLPTGSRTYFYTGKWTIAYFCGGRELYGFI